MAKVDRIAVQIKLLPLLKGDVILPLLAVDRPDVRLLREGSGRANWTFGDPNAASKPLKLPAIQHFIINDGQLRYEDQQRDIFFLGTVSSNEHATGDGQRQVRAGGKGQLNRSPFTALVTGGPLLNISPNRPIRSTPGVDAGSTHVTAKGDITKPFDLGRFETQVSVSGTDLNRLYALTGLTLPNTPPYKISGQSDPQGRAVRLQQAERQDRRQRRLGRPLRADGTRAALSGGRPAVQAPGLRRPGQHLRRRAGHGQGRDRLGRPEGRGRPARRHPARCCPTPPCRSTGSRPWTPRSSIAP